ncbi:hypothetical protein BDV39DRAFT_165076 [Aspergillus sergii]|uniref:Uncharacterized protein n=1 Tax=Aspergillus sergii TaxID=1034303 RepID=A0A5N6XLV1_9EURO|nr:hypothetical protein BDV39DRAFT_165076 [Aspergillus sergii]
MNGVFDPIDKIEAISDNPRYPNKGSELADSIAFTPSKNGECTTRLCLLASKRTVDLLADQ